MNKDKVEYRHGSVCDGCKIYTEWSKTTAGKMTPVNLKCVAFVTATNKGFIPHWATCPKAKNFRKKIRI